MTTSSPPVYTPEDSADLECDTCGTCGGCIVRPLPKDADPCECAGRPKGNYEVLMGWHAEELKEALAELLAGVPVQGGSCGLATLQRLVKSAFMSGVVAEWGNPNRTVMADSPGNDVAAIEKALNYYQCAVEERRPDWVPSRVLLLTNVHADMIRERGFVAEAGEHDCKSNQWGAISVRALNGKDLGVKPAEFQVIAWRSND